MAENFVTNIDTLAFVFGLLFLCVAVVTMVGCKFGVFDNSRWEWVDLGIVSTPKKNAQITSVIIAIIGFILIAVS